MYFKKDTEEILGIISMNQKNALKEFIRFNRQVSEESFLDMAEEKELDQYNAKRDKLISLLQEKSNISLRGIADLLGLGRETTRRSCFQ